MSYKYISFCAGLILSVNSLAMAPVSPDDARILGEVYDRLADSDDIQFIKLADNSQRACLRDVEMDHYMVFKESELEASSHVGIGTSGVGTCFAVSAIGFLNDEVVLALAHMTSLETPEYVLNKLKQILLEKGCCVTTIKFMVVGGMESHYNQQGDWMYVTCVDDELDFLRLAKQYNITAAKFNLIDNEEEGIDAFLTKNGLFIGHDLFDPLDNYPGEEL